MSRQTLCDNCGEVIPDEQEGYGSTIIDTTLPNGKTYRFWLKAGINLEGHEKEVSQWEEFDICVACFALGIKAYTP